MEKKYVLLIIIIVAITCLYGESETSSNKELKERLFLGYVNVGTLEVSLGKVGELYIDGVKIKSLKKNKGYTIIPLVEGTYDLKYIYNSGITESTISITAETFTKIKLGYLLESDCCIEFVLVESGSFNMGSNSGGYNEKPVHKVTITKDYYIGKYEVTQKQWMSVMGNNPSKFKGDNLPVEGVNWYDVIEFSNKLSIKEGLTPAYSGSGDSIMLSSSATGYRLPTEAQWEFAVKGGNKSKGYIYSGSNNAASVTWYDCNSDSKTHNVGTKQANELGIFDMSGNVSEWCYDWYDSYSSHAQTDPEGGSSDSSRVKRGGSWNYDSSSMRSANRSYYDPDGMHNYLGFRLVLPAE